MLMACPCRGDRHGAAAASGEVVARDQPVQRAARRGVDQDVAARSRSAGGDDGTGRGVESQDAAVRGDVADGYAAALNLDIAAGLDIAGQVCRSEEHTSELQSLMRNSYAVFCFKKKTQHRL